MSFFPKVKLFGNLLLFGVVIKDYFFELAFCTGESMLPTIQASGDLIIIDKTRSIYSKQLNRGDIVVLISPEDSKRLICKRLVAMV